MARPCRHTGCPNLVTSRSQKGFCDQHESERNGWAKHNNSLSSSARGYGYAWQKLRRLILERDKYLCQCEECKSSGRIRPATEVDHLIPKTKGGTDKPGNLRAINRECHKAKTSCYDSK